MRKILLVATMIITALSLACTKKDFEVTMRLTSPDGLNISFAGFYKIESTGDSTWIADITPQEYVFTLDADGDRVEGIVMKGSPDSLEILLEILVDGEERLSQSTKSATQAIQFSLQVTK
ncbi:MAG TPA: hypothetical protein EYP58_00880 [bacterium (Candidatus Stahlbacteria)]|nr:hypothetical protein [Candidatus Stahlbacteria bacterium]